MKLFLFFLSLFLFLSTIILAQIARYLPISTTGQIVKHTYYTLSYSEENEQAAWVIYLLSAENLKSTSKRANNFRQDVAVKTGSAQLIDYKGSGYDRGHLCPAADMTFNSLAMSETFYLSNISPQNSSFNRGIWKSLEDLVRRWVTKEDSLYIVTGPIFIDNKGFIGPNQVTVPGYFYKIVYDFVGDKKMIGIVIPNEPVDSKLLKNYVVSVDSIEKTTGINFFCTLPDTLETRLEARSHPEKWSFK